MFKPVVCFVIGTRPEAIKVAPVVNAMRTDGRLHPVLIASGQQAPPEPLLEALATFDLTPDLTFEPDRAAGALAEFPARLMMSLDAALARLEPVACVVHGDSLTAATSALVAFWRNIPVVHLEAGLRASAAPARLAEQGHRRMIDHLASLHLAPTACAATHLIREGLTSDTIAITGNPVVDAVQAVASRDLPYTDPRLTAIEDSNRRIVVLSVHRHQLRGERLRRVLEGVRTLVASDTTVHVVAPVPADPVIAGDLREGFAGIERVLVCDPLPYSDMARLLANASLVLTDSDGLMEEAPAFDVPVLILRELTERPEAIVSGVARLVGADAGAIAHEAALVLAGDAAWNTCGYGGNPFGDGFASGRAVGAIAWLLGLGERPEAFQPATADAVLNRPMIYAVA
jgi:UDP-N-acetylglucosamine 2-epimerase (non-hydrolysing)